MKNFDLRNFFKKSHEKVKQDEIFDLIERQIEKEKFKRKLKQNEIKSKEILEKMSPVEILTVKEQKSSSFKNFNYEILRSEILNFNFDEDCVYDFSENQIKKITKIDTKSCEYVKNCEYVKDYKLQVEFDDENLINNNLINDSYEANIHSTLINDSNQLTNISFKTLSPLDKLLFLENKINLRNKEITREILQILTDLEDLDFVKDDCARVYEKLIESGELIEELFDYKRDIRVLFKCKELSEVYLFEYAIFLNKNLLPIFYCECSKCLICKMISPLKFEELVKITTNTQFYKQDSTKLTYDQILTLEFDLFNKIKTDKTFYHVLFGFTEGQIFEKLAKNENLSLYTCVLSLFCKDLKLDHSKMDLDLILEAYDKAQALFWHLKVENGLFSVDQFDFYYKTFDELEKDLNISCDLKELVKILKIRITETTHNIQNNFPLFFFPSF